MGDGMGQMGYENACISIKGSAPEAWARVLEAKPGLGLDQFINAALRTAREGQWVPVAGLACKPFGASDSDPCSPRFDDEAGYLSTAETHDIGTITKLQLIRALIDDPLFFAVGYSDVVAGAARAMLSGVDFRQE